jgi:hypothetical protein
MNPVCTLKFFFFRICFRVLSFHERKTIRRMKLPCCLCVFVSLLILNQWTNFHGSCHELYAIGRMPNRLILNFLQSVITWRAHEILRWKRH